MEAVEVRFARDCDRFGILALARDFHAHADSLLPFDAAYLSCTIAHYTREAECLALVAVYGGRVVGAMLAAVGSSPLAPVKVSQEIGWFLSPGARGRTAFLMLDAYEAWAVDQGCAVIGLAGMRDPRLARLYARRGFRAVEDHFMRVVG